MLSFLSGGFWAQGKAQSVLETRWRIASTLCAGGPAEELACFVVRGHRAGPSGTAGCLRLLSISGRRKNSVASSGLGDGVPGLMLCSGTNCVNLSFLWQVRGSTGPATDGGGAGEVESCFSLAGLEPGPWDQSRSRHRSSPRDRAPGALPY